VEKLKDAIEIEKQNLKSECDKLAGFIMPDYLEKDLQARFTLLKFAEAAVESGGKLGAPVASPSPFLTHESGLAEGYNAAIVSCLPAFALLQSEYKELEKERDEISEENGALKYSEAKLIAELAEAKREINHLHECLNSLNASLDKQKLEDMGVANARLAAFEKRVKGITESDIEHILTFHWPEKCAAAVLALVRECKTVAEVLAKLEAPGPEKEER